MAFHTRCSTHYGWQRRCGTPCRPLMSFTFMDYYTSLMHWRLDCAAAGQPVVLTEHVGLVPYANPIVTGAERLAMASVGRLARRCDRIAVLNRRIAEEVRPLAAPARRSR